MPPWIACKYSMASDSTTFYFLGLAFMRLARKQTFGLSAFACLALFNSLFALNESATANDDHKTIVLRNATVHTMGSQGTFKGSVVVSDGKITAVGTDVETPNEATVYDLTGCHVVPGLIESRGKLWLTPAALTETNTKAELNAVDAIDPWSEDWRELASQGITSVYVQQSSASSLGGYGSVLRVGPHGSPEDIVLKKDVGVQASIGTRGSTSKDRYAQIKALEKLLESAKEKKAKDSDDDKKKDEPTKKDDANKDEEKESGKKDANKKDDESKAEDTKAALECLPRFAGRPSGQPPYQRTIQRENAYAAVRGTWRLGRGPMARQKL
jgi:hypothetical protein